MASPIPSGIRVLLNDTLPSLHEVILDPVLAAAELPRAPSLTKPLIKPSLTLSSPLVEIGKKRRAKKPMLPQARQGNLRSLPMPVVNPIPAKRGSRIRNFSVLDSVASGKGTKSAKVQKIQLLSLGRLRKSRFHQHCRGKPDQPPSSRRSNCES